MLEFLQELKEEEQTDQQGQITVEVADEPQRQEYLTVSTDENKVRKNTIVLAVLSVLGLLSLVFMIVKSRPDSAGAEAVKTDQSQIETAIAELTGVKTEMFSRIDEIVRKFEEFSDIEQVKVEELAKNPFRYERFSAMSHSGGGEAGFDFGSLLAQQQSADMELVSIMQTENGRCCMINDKILYEGDTIKGFTVSKISERSVELKASGMKVTMKLME